MDTIEGFSQKKFADQILQIQFLYLTGYTFKQKYIHNSTVDQFNQSSSHELHSKNPHDHHLSQKDLYNLIKLRWNKQRNSKKLNWNNNTGTV